MAVTLAELRRLSDEDLEAKHDQIAPMTVVGAQFYMDELRARSSDRLNASVERLTRKIHVPAVIVTVASLIQLGIAVWGVFRA